MRLELEISTEDMLFGIHLMPYMEEVDSDEGIMLQLGFILFSINFYF